MHALLYRSRARPGITATHLNAIVADAETRNRAVDVTGLLLYGHLQILPGAPGAFAQWLEGPESVVSRLFATITADDRHEDVERLAEGSVAELTAGSGLQTPGGRLFPDWSMGLVRLAELPATHSGFLTFAQAWHSRTALAEAA